MGEVGDGGGAGFGGKGDRRVDGGGAGDAIGEEALGRFEAPAGERVRGEGLLSEGGGGIGDEPAAEADFVDETVPRAGIWAVGVADDERRGGERRGGEGVRGGGDAERFVVVGEVFEAEGDLGFAIGSEMDGG